MNAVVEGFSIIPNESNKCDHEMLIDKDIIRVEVDFQTELSLMDEFEVDAVISDLVEFNSLLMILY